MHILNATDKLLKNTNEPSSIRKHCSRCSTLPSVRPSCQRPAVKYSDPRGNDCEEDPDTPSRHSCGSLAASSVPIGSWFPRGRSGFFSGDFKSSTRVAARANTRINNRESCRDSKNSLDSRARALLFLLSCTFELFDDKSIYPHKMSLTSSRKPRPPTPVNLFATLFP